MVDPSSTAKDQLTHAKSTPDRADGGTVLKLDSTQQRVRTGSSANGQEAIVSASATSSKTSGIGKGTDEIMKPEDASSKAYAKAAMESEVCLVQYLKGSSNFTNVEVLILTALLMIASQKILIGRCYSYK